jgi:hypothetical protein
MSGGLQRSFSSSILLIVCLHLVMIGLLAKAEAGIFVES